MDSDFVRHEDRSTDRAIQFAFLCDACGGAWTSVEEPLPAGFRRFMDRMLARPAPDREAALGRAVDAARARFKRCARCRLWSCVQACWDGDPKFCKACKRRAAGEAKPAAVEPPKPPRAAPPKKTTIRCASCFAVVPPGTYCPECGKTLSDRTTCRRCGIELKADLKFCPDCGEKL